MKTIAQRIIDDKVVINSKGDPKLGAEIVQAFKERGIDTLDCNGDSMFFTYYGIYKNVFSFDYGKYAVDSGCTEFIERYPLKPNEDIEKEISPLLAMYCYVSVFFFIYCAWAIKSLNH